MTTPSKQYNAIEYRYDSPESCKPHIYYFFNPDLGNFTNEWHVTKSVVEEPRRGKCWDSWLVGWPRVECSIRCVLMCGLASQQCCLVSCGIAFLATQPSETRPYPVLSCFPFLSPSWRAVRCYRPSLEVRTPIAVMTGRKTFIRWSPSWEFQGLSSVIS